MSARHHSRRSPRSHSKHKKSRKGDRSRSRDKQFEKEVKRDSSEEPNLMMPFSLQGLKKYRHFFYLSNESCTIGTPYAVWNLVVKHSSRPASVLVICTDAAAMSNLKRVYRLSRPFFLVEEHTSAAEFVAYLNENKYEVIIVPQTKLSLLLTQVCTPEESLHSKDRHPLDLQLKQCFELILACSMCFDSEYYCKLTELLIPNGSLMLLCNKPSQSEKLSKRLQIQAREVKSELSAQEINKELLSDVQFQSRPSSEIIELVKMLPYSLEETAGRLLKLQVNRFVLPRSLHLQMAGYITYKLSMEVEFNSLKYVWNFLNEELPEGFLEEIRGMQKFQNQKGVVFNVPEECKHTIQGLIAKITRNRKKYKGITLEEPTVLPVLEDVNSLEYKLMKEKKQFAMDHKEELEVFIGGAPYDMSEEAIRKMFAEQSVTVFMVRILKDEEGFSKGIAFALCENKLHFEKALTLNGTKIGDRVLRVKLANQKHRDEHR